MDAFWQQHGLDHITPRNLEWPEGFDVFAVLRDFIGNETVHEIGCGHGRLCRAFKPSQYIGTDINIAVLNQARDNHRDYVFPDRPQQIHDVTLLYTVALHIEDDRIAEFLGRITTNKIIIAEIMNPDCRVPGDIPVFNRDRMTYIDLMADHNYDCHQMQNHRYQYYNDQVITFLEFVKC